MVLPLPPEARQRQPLPVYNSIKELSDGSGALSPATKHRLYDVDTLNAIKKANDLASKKVEITNHIFEMLVKEISDDLFPRRSN